MQIIFYANLITAIVFSVMVAYAAFISILEKEITAAKRIFVSGILVSGFFFATAFFLNFYTFISSIIVYLSIFIVSAILFSQKKYKLKFGFKVPEQKIDERDVMFSRMKMQAGSERYSEYYADKPEIKAIDDKIRLSPGLLSEGTTYFNKFGFASANANFEAVEFLYDAVDLLPKADKVAVEPTGLSTFLCNWTKNIGAHSVGITELKDYHVYSHKGRGERYGKPIYNNHKYAIAFTVEMDYELTSAAPAASIVSESSNQYLNAGVIATQIASFIRELGYEAKTHIDGNYEVICPLVAKDAGLGEIGRMGLLMTPKLGPRVRIAVVTTNIPLITDKYVEDANVQYFCSICEKCADTCPGKAIPKGEMPIVDGERRWKINSEACFAYWCIAGTDCGRCMAVCPYSHPNNFLHNFIRFGIKNSTRFAKLALLLDDLIYDRKPKPKALPDWMKSC